MTSYDFPQGIEQSALADQASSPEPSPNEGAKTLSTPRRFGAANGLVLVGGVFVFAFSFLPFVSYTDSLSGPIERGGYDTWFNAWEAQTFMAPATWFAVLAAVAAAGLSVLNLVWRRPITVLRFTAPQLQVIASVFAFVTLLGYATSAKSVVFGSSYAQYLGGKAFVNGIDFAVGGYLMLAFALLCSVGAVVNLYDIGPVLFRRGHTVASPTATAPLRR